MPSSIFNFRRLDGNGAVALLLAILVLYFCALEVAMRTVVPKFVKAERRYGEDYKAAVSLRPESAQGSKGVLLAGNSLLLLGVDRIKLQQAMTPTYSVVVFPIENTTYLDWYFGLRRFLAEGSRPSTIVLCLSPSQLLSNSTNGEAFAQSMMNSGDIIRVARAARLDNTTASNYFFASFSKWLGGRWYVRNWLLEKWMPDSNVLVGYFTPMRKRAAVPAQAVTDEALRRLKELQELSKANGASFVFLVPPSPVADDAAAAIQSAAAQAGIAVSIPFLPGEMPGQAFSDGFHLNSHGANLFTERLQFQLRDALTKD